MLVPLNDWSAWAPGINSINDWQLFLNNQLPIDESESPDVSFLPAMFRRKLSPLTRMVFTVFNKLKDQESLKNIPLIFASRHGELDLSISLINSGLEALPCSPAKFSISVHNSPVGLLSIQTKNTRSSTAVSSGKRTLEMGLIEALGICREFNESLLIYADMPLSKEYEEYNDQNVYPVSLALHLKNNCQQIDINFDDKKDFQATSLIKQLISK